MDYTITVPLDELEGFSLATYTTGGLPADKSWHSLIMKASPSSVPSLRRLSREEDDYKPAPTSF
jgi:hypothetical protein